MKKTIISQDGVIALNYDAVKMLYIRPAETEDAETREIKEVYAVAAVIIGEEEPVALGFYPTKERTEEVFSQLIESLNNDLKSGYVLPYEEEDE